MFNHIDIIDCRSSYVALVQRLIERGKAVTTRGLKTIEMTGITLELSSPENVSAVMLPIGVNRGINLKLAAVEALQIIGGGSYPNLVSAAAPTFNDVLVAPDNPDFGAYGPRVTSQLDDVADLLRADPSTRRAVATIWRAGDLTHNGDRPCTLTLQFLIRDGELQLHVNMRSQDVWLGVPYDLFMFTQLQMTMARQLNVEAGKYIHHVASLHIYESDVERASQLTWPDHSKPRPVLPRGINFGGTKNLCLWNIADWLISGDATTSMRAANPWYIQQINKVKEIDASVNG